MAYASQIALGQIFLPDSVFTCTTEGHSQFKPCNENPPRNITGPDVMNHFGLTHIPDWVCVIVMVAFLIASRILGYWFYRREMLRGQF